MSRIVEFSGAGRPEVLRFKNVDVPEAGPGQVFSHHVSAAMNPVQSGKLARLIVWPIDADPHSRIALRAGYKLILAGYTLDRGQARQQGGHHFFHLDPG